MALAFLFDPNKQFQNPNGTNAVGGFLRVYLNGTDDAATTYKDFNGTLNEADIELDANGRAVVIVDNMKTYRLEVYSFGGTLMWTVNNFTAQGGGGGSSVFPISVNGTEDEIDVDQYSSGGVKYFVVGLAQAVKNSITSLASSVTYLASGLAGKKDRQAPVSVSGGTTKTLVGISQDSDGVMTPEFDDIDFDSKVLSFFPQSIGFMTPDERAALNAKMQEVAYNGGIIILWDGLGANFPSVLYYYDSSEYRFYRIEKYGNNIEYHESNVTYDGVTKTFNVDQSITTIDPALYEKVANKKTTITGNESSTTYYPNMKAVVDYINGVMQNLGGKLITDNGAPFSDSADLPSSTPYNGIAIQDKDYAYVQGDGTAERWSASVTGSSVSWVNEYTINIPVFSVAQQEAIDSGITAAILSDLQDGVASIPTKTSQLTNNSNFTTNAALTAGLATKQDVISNLSTIESGAAAGATAVQPSELNNYATTTALNNGLAGKQNTISDLAAIRSGASAGSTAVQPGALAPVATSGSYSDLSGTPTIPTNTSQLNNDSGFITSASVPTVNNGALTIKQNNATIGVFSANQSNNLTLDLHDHIYYNLTPKPNESNVSLCTDGDKYTWGTTGSQLQVARATNAARYIDIGTLHIIRPSDDVEGVAHFDIVGKLSTWANENNSLQFRADVCVEFRSRAGYGEFETSRIYGRILYKGNSSQLSNITVVTTEVIHQGEYLHHDLIISLSIPNAANNYTRIAVESFYAMNSCVGEADGISMGYTRDITIYDSVPTSRTSNQSYELPTLQTA